MAVGIFSENGTGSSNKLFCLYINFVGFRAVNAYRCYHNHWYKKDPKESFTIRQPAPKNSKSLIKIKAIIRKKNKGQMARKITVKKMMVK
jgi:hypothetical protein